MKRIFLIFAILASIPCAAQYSGTGYDDLYDTEVISRLKEHVGYFSAAMLEGRKAGSEGEKEAALYFTQALQDAGVDVLSGPEGDLFGLKQPSGDTLTSRNVTGFIPGYDRELKNHYIVIGARLDNLGTFVTKIDGEDRERICYGANGNGSGLAMLIELARRLNTNSIMLKRSVIIAAFGSSLLDNAGSWYFLNRSFPDTENIDAMINLDMVGTGTGGFYGYSASNPDMNAIAEALAGTLQPVQPQIVSLEPVASDHRSFYNSRIPSMFFTTGMYPQYNSDKDSSGIIDYDSMDKELEYVYNFALQLANGPKPVFNAEEELKKRTEKSPEDNVVPYYRCDTKPKFLGSQDPRTFLSKWVYVYMRYPEEAVQNGIQGRVLVDFIVDESGKVTDVKVLKGVHPLLDDEAVRVVESSPDWKAGILGGEKVRSEISLYIEFRLEKKGSGKIGIKR